MKKYKKERGGIFLLLIRSYIFFSIIVVLSGIAIGIFSMIMIEKISGATLEITDNDKKILRNEEFDKLDLRSIAGYGGIIEILDENNDVIYTSSNESNKSSYTERELKLIQDYEYDNVSVNLYSFKDKNNKEHKLIISTPYDYDENGYLYYDSDKSWIKVLDSDLNVVYNLGNNVDDSESYTEEELSYLLGAYSNDYSVNKYEYINNKGERRIAIIKIKKSNEDIVYENFDRIANLSLFLFFIVCGLCIVFLGISLKKKVKKPLDKLNRAMQLLSEGVNNEPIIYSGPKEFVEICDSFNLMINKLESSEIEKNKLIKDRQSMLADISHDLKTPITTIQGYAKALVDGVISEDEYDKYFNIIYSKSKRLTDLINIFYEYSKLEHPDFNLVFERVDLAEYLRAYVASKYEDILESGFDVEVDIPEKILEFKLDKIQFQRVLDNLLGNSMKHNPVGTTIYISLKIEKDKYRIIIADNGVGIPKEIMDNIFSPFIVGDESRNTKQGSGLGLAITKKIVEMHCGSIKLNNDLKKKYKTVFEMEFNFTSNDRNLR